jgi:hypothetical protein
MANAKGAGDAMLSPSPGEVMATCVCPGGGGGEGGGGEAGGGVSVGGG